MKLYCVRHGEAVSALDNSDRPLTQQGIQEIKVMAQHLKECGVHVQHVIHSQRSRARDTALILAEALQPHVVTESANGLDETDSVEDMVEMIRYWHDDTMIVGHMPFMSRLVSALLIDDSYQHLVNFHPGTIVCLESDSGSNWVINWVLMPNIIR